MIRYCLLMIASTLLVACENAPAETIDPPGTGHTHPKPANVGSIPLEKPDDDDFFNAPKVP